ncbi:MAG TPA: hypothetical protein VFG43_14915 [Geminicoccaceae bacterium]|nr:hypothetical protein [Geminicoccaceae bacterium]
MRGNRIGRLPRGYLLRFAGVAVLAGLVSAVSGGAAAADEATLSPELQAARAALEKYKDPVQAVHDGYFSTLGCVHYADGGMGVHFLSPGRIGPVPDPASPQILVYEPDEEGKLHLVAAEWFVPLATGVKERPALFGQPFNGPMEGHVPLMPKELHHYDLHVWLFKDNPAGMFNVTNPDVTCTGPYALLEEPPPDVPHH